MVVARRHRNGGESFAEDSHFVALNPLKCIMNNSSSYLQPKYVGGVVVILVFASLFYWYEWRPSQIRQECYEIAKERGIGADRYDTFRKSCLDGKGL